MTNIEFSNISETVLIINGIITFNQFGRRSISLKLPTIEDDISDRDFAVFLGICHLEIEDMKEKNLGFSFDSKGEMILGLIAFHSAYSNILLKFLNKIVINLVEDKGYLSIEEESITDSEINYIVNLILVAMGHKKLEEVSMNRLEELKKEEDRIKNLTTIERQHEETMKKLERAKARKRERQSASSGGVSLDKVIVGVMKTFNYKAEDIKKLNYFTLYHLFGYVYKIESFERIERLYANGHLKEKTKMSHWLD